MILNVDGMREVTQAEFFAAVGKMDVHPVPCVASFKNRHHESEWQMQHSFDRKRVGVSLSDSHANEPSRFWLAR